MLTTLEVSDIERVFVERGPAIMRDGEIVVQGRALKREHLAKRGFGLVKVIFRHGEKGNKTPEMPPVAKEDVVSLPLYLREYAPMKSDGAYRRRIQRPDGKHLVIVTGEGGIKDGMRLVTMFVDEPTEPASKRRPGVPHPTGVAR